MHAEVARTIYQELRLLCVHAEFDVNSVKLADMYLDTYVSQLLDLLIEDQFGDHAA